MQYTMLIYETEADFNARTSEEQAKYWGAWKTYHQALVQAGVIAGGNALQPPATGTTVRMGGGKRHVQDGPYADTKEQLGGFILLDVPSLDAALDWAARCPAAVTGAVEVRPIRTM
ncbi:MAG TPA: YciI family protein [Methylomirabilota bacterium]|nr:YciI family protein [Methylomirabilota bacterium]